MDIQLSRRNFLNSCAAATASTVLPQGLGGERLDLLPRATDIAPVNKLFSDTPAFLDRLIKLLEIANKTRRDNDPILKIVDIDEMMEAELSFCHTIGYLAQDPSIGYREAALQMRDCLRNISLGIFDLPNTCNIDRVSTRVQKLDQDDDDQDAHLLRVTELVSPYETEVYGQSAMDDNEVLQEFQRKIFTFVRVCSDNRQLDDESIRNAAKKLCDDFIKNNLNPISNTQ